MSRTVFTGLEIATLGPGDREELSVYLLRELHPVRAALSDFSKRFESNLSQFVSTVLAPKRAS